MRNIELNKAGHASIDDLPSLAAQGLQRALAVRLTDLSAEQTRQVSGGALANALSDDYCGNGLRPIPKLGGGGTVIGEVIIINGQFPRQTPGV